MSASPSTPAGSGRSASTWKDGVVHSRHRTLKAALTFIRRRAHDGDAEQTVVDARTGAGTDRTTEAVAVVGDEHGGSPAVFLPARPRPAHIEVAATGAEGVGHGVEQSPDLRRAVAGALDGFGVHAERHVVDEHPPVDLGEVHQALAAVDEGVQSTDHVVTVDPEVEREVVAGAGRHAGVGQREFGGDRGDDRLRAVPTGHRESVGAARDRAADQGLEIVPALQLDRLDPAVARFLGDCEAFCLPATGFRVVEQHRMLRCRRGREIHVGGEAGPGRCQSDQQSHEEQKIAAEVPTQDNDEQRTDKRQTGHVQPGQARDPSPQYAVTSRYDRDHHARQEDEAARKLDSRRSRHRTPASPPPPPTRPPPQSAASRIPPHRPALRISGSAPSPDTTAILSGPDPRGHPTARMIYPPVATWGYRFIRGGWRLGFGLDRGCLEADCCQQSMRRGRYACAVPRNDQCRYPRLRSRIGRRSSRRRPRTVRRTSSTSSWTTSASRQ